MLYTGPKCFPVGSLNLKPYLVSCFGVAVCLPFGALLVHTVSLLGRLRLGEAGYIEKYNREIQMRIDKLTTKYPKLS
jgi:hypothetical protein